MVSSKEKLDKNNEEGNEIKFNIRQLNKQDL